jgi:hypothetical protein
MTERFGGRNEQPPKPQPFAGFPQVLENFVRNQLDINKIQELTRDRVQVESNPNTWISSTHSEGSMTHVSIGEKMLPEDIARQFRWGAETVEHQYVVKVAHEYAHVVQEMFDQHLLRWLDGADNTPEDAIPYIQLYASLAGIGGLHGLSQMDVYHEQNRSTGNLNVNVYEDMAETIGSYLLSSEYFLYRIQNARGQITQEQAKELVDHVVAVVANWKKGQE